MTTPLDAASHWTPCLSPGVELRFERADERWVVSVPARTFSPDDIALEVLKRCDGKTSVESIVDELTQIFSADRGQVEDDVLAMLEDLGEKGVVGA